MARRPRYAARPHRSSWWRNWRSWVGFAAVIGSIWLARQYSWTGGEWEVVDQRFTICGAQGGPACVIDGDTLAIGVRRIRLVGFDAPELDGGCPAERELAIEARAELTEWLDDGPFEIDGGADPPLDQYDRELRSVRRGEEWLAETMIEAGLARDNGWGSDDADWC